MKGTSILLVDDDQDDQMMFAEAVRKIDESISCWYASSGEEALELIQKLQEAPPDIIFLDLNMMPLNGRECLIALRKIEWLNDTPIIIYTTSNNDQDAYETKQLGATYFLTKRNSLTDIKSDIALTLQLFNGQSQVVRREK